MAKILTEEILKALKKFDLPKGYQRTGEFPLDPSSVFAKKSRRWFICCRWSWF